MKSFVKVCYFGVAVIIAMTVSLLAPIHVIADDTTPPPPVQTEEPPPVETEAPPPTDEVQTEEALSIETEEPSVTEEAAGDVTTNSLESEPSNDQENTQDFGGLNEGATQDISELIEQLPEGTGIHLETEEGVEPMTTAQAESLILVGDPIWCPAAVTDPAPNSSGCSSSYPDLADLVNNFPDPGAPGVIWITEGADLSATFISLDGANFANWDSQNLVIQGGWNGAPLGGVISSATTINVPLEIINWAGNITINDIIVSGAAGTGLSVDISGNVYLNNVETTGNHDMGLYVKSAGVVTAEDIVANNNGIVSLAGYGAMIQGSEFHLSGTNEFNGNYESGLYVSTTGDITIENLTASNNGPGYAVGAELYSASGDVDLLRSNPGSNQFISNHNDGLYVEALSGTITAENITANDNGTGHVWGPGAEFIAAGLELTGNNEFVGNYNTGLYADMLGDITIANINASDNGLPGIYGPGAELYSTGKVTITGINVFSNNSSEGLIIDANGNISIINFNALDNDSSGLVFVTNGDAYAECGAVLNNGSAQIDTAMTGELTLTGVDFGGDPDQNLWIDQSQLTLISNMCFNYPDYYSWGDYGIGELGGKKGIADPKIPPFTVKYVSIVGGQDANLDCAYYQATYVLLEDGDGAIIPCPIVGAAKLASVEEINPYGILPDKNNFISGMSLAVSGESQIFKPIDAPDIIWYFNGGGYEAVYWDGNDWVDLTDQIPPFLTIFFLVPEEFDRQDLAILFWDGTNWIELSNDTHMGQGRIVSGLGYNGTGEYFQANVNFVGVFILVQK